jgi:hypothetical protein
LEFEVNIEPFKLLLESAKTQPEPQRLLFVFASAELPADATQEQRLDFEQGDGGSLSPVLCVDKLPEQLSDFPSLILESEQTGKKWDVVFVAGLSGRAGIAPNTDEAAQPLQLMVEAIKDGRIGQFMVLSRQGEMLALDKE